MIDGAYFRISLWIVLKILAILLINRATKASVNHFFQRPRVMICIFSRFPQDFLKISSKFPRFFSTSPIFSQNFHSSPGFSLRKKQLQETTEDSWAPGDEAEMAEAFKELQPVLLGGACCGAASTFSAGYHALVS